MSASPAPSDPGSPDPVPGAGAATQAALIHNIFGNDDDESDLSDPDLDEPQVQRRIPFPPRLAPTVRPENDDDDEEDKDSDRDDVDDADEGDVYVPGTVEAAAKIPKFKKKKVDDDDDVAMYDDEDPGEGERRKKRRKKEKKRSRRERDDVVEGEETEEVLPTYDEDTRVFFSLSPFYPNAYDDQSGEWLWKGGLTTLERKQKSQEGRRRETMMLM